MTGNPTHIPNSKVPVLDPADGSFTLPWRRFLQNLPATTTTPSGVTSFDGRTGDVILTAVDVEDALGFTPGQGTGDGTVITTGFIVPGQTAVFSGQTSITGQNPVPLVAGFGFFASGPLKSGELLGSAIYALDVAFSSSDGAQVVSLIPAVSAASFGINAIVAGTLTSVGSIDFAAGARMGAVTWDGGGYSLPAGGQIQVTAPSPADASLASVNGDLTGTVA